MKAAEALELTKQHLLESVPAALNEIHELIRQTSRNGVTECVYKRPVHSTVEDKLKEDGYFVTRGPSYILVRWDS